jgi:hypothetical protein
MEDRNQPVPRSCPHCGAAADLMPKVGDYEIYGCPHCGYYRINGINKQLIANGMVDPKAAQIHQRKDGNRWLRPGQYRSYRSGRAALGVMTERGEGQLKGTDHACRRASEVPGRRNTGTR